MARHPESAARAGLRCALDLTRTSLAAASRAAGRSAAGPVPPDAGDRRFSDPAWEDNAAFFALRQSYLVLRRLAEDLLAAAELDTATRAKAEFAVDLLADALAPTNLLLTNPAALKRAFETGGQSVVAGSRNCVDDILHNGGRPRQVDASSFRLGENMAATPSKVVYRNDVMELLQYLPQTDEVHATPLLASPPWINKYYVMDLAPGRSLIEWAVQHGRTVFAISYRNPDSSLSGVTMDDYLVHGTQAALDVVTEITRSDTVDVLAVCLGGALAAMNAAHLAASGKHAIGTLTLINTLLDYAEPGQLGCFVDEGTVRKLERRMAQEGLPRRCRYGGRVQRPACQRADLQLRGVELADGRTAAGLRPAGVERRLDAPASRDALLVPALVLPGKPAGEGNHGARWAAGSTSPP